ncbi:MAG: hypothetical protein HY579_01265 [Nitrospinae bacterium]|nr:hypothetical protein [Nitrospinota bacterium]
MTPMQRVLTALGPKEPDRVPLFLLLTMHGAKELGMSIERHYSKAEHVVEGQIKQVILNLAQNAEEAAGEQGGRIAITTEADESAVRISIEDTGKGILPERMGSIFDPFFATKSAVKGSGLGLAVSYGIIMKHGGKIDAQSRTGEGTVFTVSLPVHRE